jgi:hypothetical protein
VIGPRVLVKPLEASERSSGGVVIPQEARKRETRGMVIAVGESRGGHDGPCEVGDVVVWDASTHMARPYLPVPVTLDLNENGHAEEFVVLDWADILIVLEEASVEAPR